MRVSRRNFLKGAGALGAGAFVGGMLGCSAPRATANSADEELLADASNMEEAHDPVEIIECDVVVIGSGTAGTCAALSAAERGGNVIVLEKLAVLGGSSLFAEGVGAIGSDLQKEKGIEVTVKEMVDRSDKYHHYACNHGVLQRFMEESGATINWLAAHGVTFYDAMKLGDSAPTWHTPYEGGRLTGAVGSYMLPILFDAAEECGVTFMTNTSATSLFLEEGSVKGVYAQSEKGEILLQAGRGVVLATGGYGNNAEMFKRFTNVDVNTVRYWGTEGHDGDGIAMGVAAGAALHKPGAVQWCLSVLPHCGTYEEPVASAFGCWTNLQVNETGQRFCSEGTTSDFTYIGNAFLSQNRVVSILTQAEVDLVESEGFTAPITSTIPPIPGFADMVKEDQDVAVFDTLDELATHFSIDAEGLARTVELYNGYCETGVDEEFGKPAEFLRPCSSGPYYAAQLMTSFFTTVGGLKVDRLLRVVSEDGDPIEGLYAVGCDAAGLYGFDYDVGTMSGGQQGWCATGGRLVGEYLMA